jgi:DNA-binding IclR family transcriptional regulator
MKTSRDRNPGSIQVIERMAHLLEAIARYTRGVSLKVLAAETGLHPSTAFRILASLAEHGFVERDEAGAYRLGRRLVQLSARAHSGIDLRQEALPIMEKLRDEIGETVNLTVREGDEVIYVERATPNRMIRVEQVIGSRAPLHVTAVGKLMLGAEGEPATRKYAGRTGLPGYTANTLNDPERLLIATRQALSEGYALDNEEAELGVGCIGALVRDASGVVVAGLSISAPIERRRSDWIPLLQKAARNVSERLGYRGEEGS